ncbi:MAG TPA: hypothetical protein VJI73_04495 [Candidatus Paceibacterota bacterium]
MTSTLSPQALAVIDAYRDIPYYNNKHHGIRMGFRTQVGKGAPGEINDEAHAFALAEKVDWPNLTSELRKKYLVDHHLGVDCSGFIYHVLDAEAKARGLDSISKSLEFPFANGLLSRLDRVLRGRYVENADVQTFAHAANSRAVKKDEIQAGDFVVIISPERKHMMLISKVDNTTLEYVESTEFGTKDKYDSGLRRTSMLISKLELPVQRLYYLH